MKHTTLAMDEMLTTRHFYYAGHKLAQQFRVGAYASSRVNGQKETFYVEMIDPEGEWEPVGPSFTNYGDARQWLESNIGKVDVE